MSLLKRLWVSVVSVMLIALLGTLALNILSARDYLEQQLYAQGNDGAAGLALSISQHGADAAMTELLVSALFDSGHFASVRYLDLARRVVVERSNPIAAPGAPAWFVSLFPLRAGTGSAEVSDGWKQAGSVEVTATSGFAHASLWRASVRLAGLTLILAAALGAVMTLLVRWINRSLSGMVEQAAAIGEGRFVTAVESDVPELKVMSRALNTMVGLVASMFSEQAARIEKLRDAANRDTLTGLPSRSYFMGRLREAVDVEAASESGALLLVRMNDLAGLNRRRGRLYADECVRKLADTLRAFVQERPEMVAARLNGSDFALLAPACDRAAGETLAARLTVACSAFRQTDLSDADPVAYVGGACYTRTEPAADVLARADAMLAQGEAGRPAVAQAGSGADARARVKTPDQWQALLDRAVKERSFTVSPYPVVAPDGRLIHYELMLRLTTNGSAVTAAEFVPMAIRLERIAEVDLIAVELALDEIAGRGDPAAVNLCGVSLRQPGFIERIVALLRSRRELTERLSLELGERSLSDDEGMSLIGRLSAGVAPFGCRLGIDQFGRHFSAMPRLYEAKIDYVKIDGSFVADVDANPGSRHFIEALVQVARSLGIATYAEHVSTEAERSTLVALTIDGMTGPAVTRHQ